MKKIRLLQCSLWFPLLDSWREQSLSELLCIKNWGLITFKLSSRQFVTSSLLVTENSMGFVLWMYNKACNVWVPGNSSILFTLESPYFSCLCLRKHWYWRGKQLFPKEPDFKCISNKRTFHELPWLKSTRNLLTRATKGNKEQLKLGKVWLSW